MEIWQGSAQVWLARAWQKLGVSHLRTVVGHPSDTQNQLLTVAEHEEWTVATLEHEVVSIRAKNRNSGGRKPIPRYVKTIRRIFDLTKPEAFDGLESLAHLELDEVEELSENLNQCQTRLGKLSKILASETSGVRSRRRPTGASAEDAQAG